MTSEIREIIKNSELAGGMITEDERSTIIERLDEIDEEIKMNESAIEDLQNDLSEERDNVSEAEEEGERLSQKLNEALAADNLIDEMKLKICRNLFANLTEEELTKLERFAKEQFKKPGIIYKEVL